MKGTMVGAVVATIAIGTLAVGGCNKKQSRPAAETAAPPTPRVRVVLPPSNGATGTMTSGTTATPPMTSAPNGRHVGQVARGSGSDSVGPAIKTYNTAELSVDALNAELRAASEKAKGK